MKKRFLLTAALVMFALPARGENIGIYTSEFNRGCSFSTGFSSTVHVILIAAFQTTAVRFRIEPPAGSNIMGFVTPYGTIGTITDDISIAFGQCLYGTIPLGTLMAEWTYGTAWVRPALGQPTVLKADCAFLESPIAGCSASFGFHSYCCDQVLETESTTWGKVKSLYR